MELYVSFSTLGEDSFPEFAQYTNSLIKGTLVQI